MSKLPRLKPPKIFRKPPRISRLATEKHARQIGEIVIAWNYLHSNLFSLFSALLKPKTLELTKGIWHSIQSDSGQLELLLTTARAILTSNSRELSNILWIGDRVKDIRPQRNDLVHTAINLQWSSSGKIEVIPDIVSTRKQVLVRMKDLPPAAVWRKVRGDLWALAYYTMEVWVRISVPQVGTLQDGRQIPLPHRPRMLSVRQSTRHSRKVRRPKAKRGKPPPS